MSFTGMPNVWWMPIQTRTEMLATGVRSPLGIQVLGPDLEGIDACAAQIEAALVDVPGHAQRLRRADRRRPLPRLRRRPRRRRALRAQRRGRRGRASRRPIGGKTVTTTVEGRERYPITVRYARDFRSSLADLERVLVATADGAQIPLAQVAHLASRDGAADDPRRRRAAVTYVFVDTDRPIADYVAEARRAVAAKVKLPPGYRLEWAGQFKYFERAKERLNSSSR